ncbi:hypothetical protein BOX15_Mlig025882g1 [Macrostomum lignano]|nr:hypothetical protein BOX15_Mlig025882g1 [Macrostomum lignano]
MSNQTKARVVRNDDRVDRGIWWYEDVKCPEVDAAIEERLRNGEKVTLTYGKLMERLLLFSGMSPVPSFYPMLIPVAEHKLQETTLNLESPVVVIGDASSSMNVAIRTATIISSLLSAIIKCDLIFFNVKSWSPEANPRTIEEVLSLARSTKASGCTAHAAALYPYYERKEIVRTFIVVTDEEENTDFQGTRFFPLFERYRQEVFDAKLVFVSFLRQQHSRGQMVYKAAELGLNVQQFVLNGSRPDLNKLDSILGRLGVQCSTFEEEVQKMTDRIGTEGLREVFDQLFGSDSSFDEL